MRGYFTSVFVALVGTMLAVESSAGDAINWQPWSDGQFAEAKRENRFVILDLEAVWCHWCHVMDDTTYADPPVQKLIGDKYIAVRVDQDSRPDISNRYEDYGWPATVVFDSAGHEIVKRRGYLPPKEMAAMLQAIIDDPTPGPSVQPEVQVRPADAPGLTDAQRGELIQRLKSDYDQKNAGWFGAMKYVDPGVVEYCLIHGDSELRKMAEQTLDANMKLIDPVWGGADQYSTDSGWDHPHFEKIMSTQADNLRIYSQAYLATGNAAYLTVAEHIHGYLRLFLTSPDAAFYVSQDADLHPGEHSAEYFKLNDVERRKLGVPRVDQHRYARENGWAIRSFCTLYAATDDPAVLKQAIDAAMWVIKNRSIAGGGFTHDQVDAAGPYLGDTLAMGDAFIALYEVTADRAWLERAREATQFIDKHFAGNSEKGLGLVTAESSGGDAMSPGPEVDENVEAARFANLLFAYTGDAADRDLARNIMRYLASPQIGSHRGWDLGGILLADWEIGRPALHMTVDGAKSDAVAAQLFQTALKLPTYYKRIDWFDPAQGALPNTDVAYPKLPYPAAFVCSATSCSLPIKSAKALADKIAKIEGSGVGQ